MRFGALYISVSHISSNSNYNWRNYFPSFRQLINSGHLFSAFERKIIVCALVVFLGSFSWTIVNHANASISSKPVAGGEYTEGLVGQPKFINPVFATTSAIDTDLTRLVFAGLMRYDNNLVLQNDLADKIEISENGTQYTITLKENLYWHNGDALTAHDIKFTFDNIIDPEVNSPLSVTFQNVVTEVIDDRTLRVSLPQPYKSFSHVLTTGIISQKIWDPIPRNEWRDSDFNLRPIGNGAWQFSTFKQSQGELSSYTLRKNELYHTPSNIDKLVFKFFNTEEAAISALQARAIQGFAYSLGDAPDDNERQSGITYTQLSTPGSTAIFFNLGKTGPLENRRVREALRLAIDRRQLTLSFLNGKATPLYQLLPKHLLPSDIKLPATQSDAKAAEDLLDRAGWERIGAIRKNDDDQTLSIKLTVVDREPDKQVANFIQRAWQDIGVDVSLEIIKPVTAENIQKQILEQRSYDALLFTTVYGAEIDLYPFWHSSQRVHPGLNLSQLTDQSIDDLIIQLRQSKDETEGHKILERIITQIDEIVPAIFLYSPEFTYAQSDKIRGMMNTQISTPSDRFNSIESWFADRKFTIEFEKSE